MHPRLPMLPSPQHLHIQHLQQQPQQQSHKRLT
jgi:hypothetical protein